MKPILPIALLFATTATGEKRQECSSGATDDNGNWYCQEIHAITYTGVGGSGSYNRVTDMIPEGSGSCPNSPSSYAGDVAPLDQEVSLPEVLEAL